VSTPGAATTGAGVTPDERLVHTPLLRRLLARPELGAVAGAIAVWIFFAIVAGSTGFLSLSGTANYLEVAAELGIVAVPVSLLMIAGEFDLSVGTMITATGMITALVVGQYGFPLFAGILAAAAFALAVGLLNGVAVQWTRLPSFIVTLGTMFILAGITIGLTRALTGRTQIGALGDAQGYALAQTLFASKIFGTFAVSILWWIAIIALATWVLLRTRFGNWIFGAGGQAEAARNLGVPVTRVKITLFMCTALSAWLVSTIDAVKFTGADVLRGSGREFEAIIATVIGGTLLTGGYGSAIGPAFGALIFGMVQQGIVFAGVDSDWYKAFLGVMLIVAVVLNNLIRRRVGGRR
jgi:simple sugar transport system permease protein